MVPAIPWNALGIKPDARATAEAAARSAGVPISQWLNNMIRETSRPRPTVVTGDPVQHENAGWNEAAAQFKSLSERVEDIAERLAQMNLGGSDTALTRAQHAMARTARWTDDDGADQEACDPAAHHTNPDASSVEMIERTIQSVIAHLEASDRRNADALRQMQAEVRSLAERANAGRERMPGEDYAHAFEKIGERIDTLARKIEHAEGDAAPDPGLKAIEERVAALALNIERMSAPNVSQPAAAETDSPFAGSRLGTLLDADGLDGLAQGADDEPQKPSSEADYRRFEEDISADYPSYFLERLARHRLGLPPREQATAAAAAPDEPAAAPAAPAASAHDLDQQTAILSQRITARFAELAENLQRSLSNPTPPQELSDLQAMVHTLSVKLDVLAAREPAPMHDDGELRQQIMELSQRMDAAESRFAGLDSIEQTLQQLFDRIESAEHTLLNAAQSRAGGEHPLEGRLNDLFHALDASRQNMLEAAQQAAAEAAHGAAGEAARMAAQEAVREAQQAALATAREAAQSYMQEVTSAAGRGASADEAHIVETLQESLRQVRRDVDSADKRTQIALDSVQDTLRMIVGRIGQAEQRAEAAHVPLEAATDPVGGTTTIMPAADPVQPVAQAPVEESRLPERKPSPGSELVRVARAAAKAREQAEHNVAYAEPEPQKAPVTIDVTIDATIDAEDAAEAEPETTSLSLPHIDAGPLLGGPSQSGATDGMGRIEPQLGVPAASARVDHDADVIEQDGEDTFGLPQELAELKLPPLESIAPVKPPQPLDLEDATREEPLALDAELEFYAEPDQPREPGSGPPRMPADGRGAQPVDSEDDGAERAMENLRAAVSSFAADEAAPVPGRSRSANELLAAARSAASAAGMHNPPADTNPKSLRERLRIPGVKPKQSGDSGHPKAGHPKAETPAAGEASGARTLDRRLGQPEGAKRGVRKPLLLAAGAVLLLVGSIQIYNLLKPKAPALLPLPAPASDTQTPTTSGRGEPGTSPADAPQTRKDGMLNPLLAVPQSAAVVDNAAGSFGNAFADVTQTAAAASDPITVGSLPPPADTAATEPASAPADTAALALPAEIGPQALQSAALTGDPVAQFEVANRFAEGRGITADPVQAVAWYQRAAAQGLAPAQYRLASLYEKGIGTAKDANAARIWYQRAADQGNRKAMHNLAVLYADGAGDAPDFTAAANWFRAAAELGLEDSQYNLGIMHARGLGVPQNFAEAFKWFSILADKGDADAAGRRDLLAEKLDAQTLAAARLAAQTWRAKPMLSEANEIHLPDAGWEMPTPVAAPAGLPNRDIVRITQKLLTGLGFSPGPADGMWGPKTQTAIELFEQQAGLPRTGEITPDLIRKLQQKAG